MLGTRSPHPLTEAGQGLPSDRDQVTFPLVALIPTALLFSVATTTVGPAITGCAYTDPSTFVENSRWKSAPDTCAGVSPGSLGSQPVRRGSTEIVDSSA